MSSKILHFSDAHIDMVNHGRQDPISGLPIRVLDYLKSLDTIIDTAIEEKVDLVIFAGDAYKDRTPSPTYQREWGKRIMRLSRAEIPTILLIGNHDLSPSLGRAHAIQEFQTLEVPFIHVAAKPMFMKKDFIGVPLQIIALPWISKSEFLAVMNITGEAEKNAYEDMEGRLANRVDEWLSDADPDIPTILCAHASIQGAKYGSEQTVMLGSDLTLSGSLVKDPRLDYVALGHLHKAQNLNEGNHPPVIYSGSIERVDFGEANDDKYFVIAQVEKGKTSFEWRKLDHIRPFHDCAVTLNTTENIQKNIIQALPEEDKIKDAIIRLSIIYPRDMESMIDEKAIRNYAKEAFDFHIIRRPHMDIRGRIPTDKTVSTLSPLELLDIYWNTNNLDEKDRDILNNLAKEILLNEENPEVENS